jgi:hypothetical protein
LSKYSSSWIILLRSLWMFSMSPDNSDIFATRAWLRNSSWEPPVCHLLKTPGSGGSRKTRSAGWFALRLERACSAAPFLPRCQLRKRHVDGRAPLMCRSSAQPHHVRLPERS